MPDSETSDCGLKLEVLKVGATPLPTPQPPTPNLQPPTPNPHTYHLGSLSRKAWDGGVNIRKSRSKLEMNIYIDSQSCLRCPPKSLVYFLSREIAFILFFH